MGRSGPQIEVVCAHKSTESYWGQPLKVKLRSFNRTTLIQDAKIKIPEIDVVHRGLGMDSWILNA